MRPASSDSPPVATRHRARRFRATPLASMPISGSSSGPLSITNWARLAWLRPSPSWPAAGTRASGPAAPGSLRRWRKWRPDAFPVRSSGLSWRPVTQRQAHHRALDVQPLLRRQPGTMAATRQPGRCVRARRRRGERGIPDRNQHIPVRRGGHVARRGALQRQVRLEVGTTAAQLQAASRQRIERLGGQRLPSIFTAVCGGSPARGRSRAAATSPSAVANDSGSSANRSSPDCTRPLTAVSGGQPGKLSR